MSIARVQVASHSVDAGSSVAKAFTSPVTAGNCIIVVLASYYGYTAIVGASVTDTLGHTYTQAFEITDATVEATGIAAQRVWCATNITGGANTVTISGMTGAYAVMTVLEYSGVASSPVDGASGARYHQDFHGGSPSATYTSGSVTTTYAEDLLIGTLLHYILSDHSIPDTGWTVASYFAGVYHSLTIHERFVSATGSYANTGAFSIPKPYFSTGVVAFKSAGLAGLMVTGATRGTTATVYPVIVSGGATVTRHVMATWRRNRQ